MVESVAIPIANLRLDSENPRLSTPNSGQRETFREMARLQGPKLRVLAQDIVEYGLDPSELTIVTRLDGDVRPGLPFQTSASASRPRPRSAGHSWQMRRARSSSAHRGDVDAVAELLVLVRRCHVGAPLRRAGVARHEQARTLASLAALTGCGDECQTLCKLVQPSYDRDWRSERGRPPAVGARGVAGGP